MSALPRLPATCNISGTAQSAFAWYGLFRAANDACFSRFAACLESGPAAYCSESCIVYADQLAQSCGGAAGTYCSVDGRSAATGSYPAYEFHSGTCVPTACDDAYHGALQAWAEGFACGDAYHVSGHALCSCASVRPAYYTTLLLDDCAYLGLEL